MPHLDPERLRPAYSAFMRPGRVLLTGHSHQAWPDVARAGLVEAFDDAALAVDEKWSRAFQAADDLRAFIGARIGAAVDDIALGASTHDLLIRLLSALDLRARPHLVTTGGEFHSVTRQLERLAEDGAVEVTWVAPHPVATLAERLAAELRETTAAVLVSTVLYETSSVVPHTAELARRARALGVEVVFDAYHAFCAVPFTLESLGAADAFLVAGGYKYAQWGEGACFLRVPPRTAAWRPVVTGWYAGFGELADRPRGEHANKVHYASIGREAFAGATYDPSSHYRARAVARFMAEQGMTPTALRELSLAQTDQVFDLLDGLDVVTPRPAVERGAFVSVRLPNAQSVADRLRSQGVFVDSRRDLLRVGPAPYVTSGEIALAMRALRQLA